MSLYDAKTHLSQLVDDAAAGTVVTITRHGRPAAQLVAASATTRPREPGALAGWDVRDGWDEFTDDDAQAWFEE